MMPNSYDFFGGEELQLSERLIHFSFIELTSKHSGEAIQKFLAEENVDVPEWVEFLILKGMVHLRRLTIEEYKAMVKDDKQLALFPEA